VTQDEGTFVYFAIAVAVGAAFVLVLFVAWLARTRCPACGKPALELDMRDNSGGVEAGTGARMFQCARCLAEFRRLDKGPLVPRATWEAGGREAPPVAKVVR
jgi:hypothetical protein